MKKGAKAVILVIAVLMTALFLCAAAPNTQSTYKAILKDTLLYKEPDLSSEVLVKIPQNALVELNGNRITVNSKAWQPVKYTSFEGYVTAEGALYSSLKNDAYDVLLAKATTKKMGNSVALYKTHSENYPAKVSVHDGERLCIVQDGIDYGNFVMVEYDNEYYFVLKENVTTGLSYNQTLGVIIAVCFVVVIIGVIVTVFFVRRKKRF